jgi:hypothetical protein
MGTDSALLHHFRLNKHQKTLSNNTNTYPTSNVNTSNNNTQTKPTIKIEHSELNVVSHLSTATTATTTKMKLNPFSVRPSPFSERAKRHIIGRLLPNKQPEILAEHNDHVFCGLFSKDGSLFMSACQGFSRHISNTSINTFY